MPSERKVVLVTGCSKGGIGASLCDEYAAQGCIVYGSARKVESMEFEHIDIHKVKLDVTSDEEVKEAVKTIIDNEGRIDVLVNNAGANCADVAKNIYDANTFAIIRVSQAVFPHMAARRSGEIVNIGSVGGDIPTPWNGVYSSSKAAVRGISDVLWQECKPFNISITHVSAGAVTSNIATKALDSGIQMPENSLYKPYAPMIVNRVWASQGPSSIPSEQFAKRVVAASLARNPPRYMTLGGHSFLFWILSWLPRGWALNMLWKRFLKVPAHRK
ncbi:hypothetical protein EIP86_002613 [Pleurotus ostreatoroseus]|nr:hypothetical protein EIP86_002613 [Pleurotus ostreatoroseus]